MTGSVPDPGLESVAALAESSSVCWVAVGEAAARPVWHRWHDGALCLVVGGQEQPLPGLPPAAEISVVLRDHSTRQRAATVRACVEVLAPHTPAWTDVLAVLLPARLNLVDPDGAPGRWAAESTVARLVPIRANVHNLGGRR